MAKYRDCMERKDELRELSDTAYRFLQNEGFFAQMKSRVYRCTETLIVTKLLRPLIIIDFEIDLMRLLDFSIELYGLFLRRPLNAEWIFQEAVNKQSTTFDFRLSLRSTFPLVADQDVNTARNGALCLFQNYVLTAITAPALHTEIMLYRCANRICDSQKYFSVDEVQYDSRPTCPECRESMIEDLQGRKQTYRLFAKFLPSKGFKLETKLCHESMIFSIPETLRKKLEIGAVYNLWGYLKVASFKAMGLEMKHSFSLQHTPFCRTSQLRSFLFSIESKYRDNPWILVRYLSLHLTDRDQRVACFASLKMALILSLATLANGAPVPIMCIGQNSVTVSSILHNASTLATRRLAVDSPVSPLTGDTLLREGSRAWITGGTLALSSSGVCIAGCWDNIKPTQKNEISSVLGEGVVVTGNRNMQQSELVPIPLVLPLKATIWTFMHYHGEQYQRAAVLDLIDVFGIPFLATYPDTADGTMHGANESFAELLPASRISEFIRVNSVRNVELAEGAVQLIKDYFAASRRLRSYHFPIRSIWTLTTLAEGHARLSLRTRVTYDDVVAVIYLYEESLYHLFGCTTTTPPFCAYHTLGNICETMSVFKQWLENYVKSVVDRA